ncbi:MAG: hypothetical protein HGB12_12825, partial [Bacteroidetes bacterium]|nr:hypothetical protein [Bacteroidota bacterium]
MKTKKIHKTNKVLRSIVYAIIIVNCQLSIVNCIAQGGAAINTTGNEANVSAML